MSVVDLTSAFDQDASGGVLPSHVSFSQLDLMIRCPEAWRQRYLVGTRGPATTALAVGSGVHAGIAAMYDLLARHPKATRRVLQDAGTEAAIESLATIDMLDETDEADVAARLIRTYAEERPTHIRPLETEKRIEVSLPDSDIPLIGYVDVEAEKQLVEIKTSSRKVTTPTGSWRVQAWLYQAAIPKPVEWHVLVKTKTPTLLTSAELAVPYDPAVTAKAIGLASATLERIQRLYTERGPDQEWPVDGVLHPWACSLCDARPSCPVGGAS